MATEKSEPKELKKGSFDWDRVADWGVTLGFYAVQAAVGGLAAAAGAHAFKSISGSEDLPAPSTGSSSTVVPMRKSATL